MVRGEAKEQDALSTALCLHSSRLSEKTFSPLQEARAPGATCKPSPSYRSFKSSLEAGEFIQDAAQSPNITFLVVRLPFTELWGDVAWSSHNLKETKTFTTML